MGSLRGDRDTRYQKELPLIPDLTYCYDVLILRTFCLDGLGTLAYRLGDPVGFKIVNSRLLELVNLKVLPSRVDLVIERETEGEFVEYWFVDKKETPLSFSKMRLREPEPYDEEEDTYEIIVSFDESNELFFIEKCTDHAPAMLRLCPPWES